ncbi:hypothetical protein HID58_073757 [Brassica napus]|uniref:Uncharacterized protein n=1 Tax=Brassica napus TaxID=3708 RepID=A0ABQ7YEU4_BRANA|nr:hypothetical protein HID58_073757 [Brassica napus]
MPSANMENSQASTKENTEKEETEEFTTRNVTKGKTDRDMEAEVISESPAAETSAPVQTRVVEENTEGVWKDVSPSKHGRLGVKLGVQHTNVISPSRFAVLQEEGKNDVREGQDETGEKKEKEENEKEEGEITEEKKDKEGNEKDDGEMLEALTNTLEEVSEEISGEVSGDETGTDELLNQNIGKAGKSERVECPLRPSKSRLEEGFGYPLYTNCFLDIPSDVEFNPKIILGFVLGIQERELIEQGLEVMEMLVELRRQVNKEIRRVPDGRAPFVETEQLACLEPR